MYLEFESYITSVHRRCRSRPERHWQRIYWCHLLIRGSCEHAHTTLYIFSISVVVRGIISCQFMVSSHSCSACCCCSWSTNRGQATSIVMSRYWCRAKLVVEISALFTIASTRQSEQWTKGLQSFTNQSRGAWCWMATTRERDSAQSQEDRSKYWAFVFVYVIAKNKTACWYAWLIKEHASSCVQRATW